MLRLRHLVLVPPSYWEDPLEDMPSSMMMQGPNGHQKPLSVYHRAAFCQCWSFESESDSLLRAYSRVTIDKLHRRNIEPQREGVQIRTTPRKLATALSLWAKQADWGEFYLGRVQYHDHAPEIVTKILARVGPYEMGRSNNRAESLLLKRKAFAHKDEMRLIWVSSDERDGRKPISVSVDPNEFVEEIRFDPRLISFERLEREGRAKALGYQGPFSNSAAYQGVLFQTFLSWDWEEWENGNRPNQIGSEPMRGDS